MMRCATLVAFTALAAGARPQDGGPDPVEAAWAERRPAALPLGLDEFEQLLEYTAAPERLEELPPAQQVRLAQRMLLLAATLKEHEAAWRSLASVEGFAAAAARMPRLSNLGDKALGKALRQATERVTSYLGSTLRPAERRELSTRMEMLLPSRLEWLTKKERYELITRNDALVDAVFGLRYAQTEDALPAPADAKKTYGRNNTYIGFNLKDNELNTSYADLEAIVGALKLSDGDTVVDLGSGYGRVGLYLGVRAPAARFIGYEIVKQRVQESARVIAQLGLARARVEEVDMAAPGFELPEAEVFFAYDPVDDKSRARLFDELARVARKRSFKLAALEGNMTFFPALKKLPWLKQTAQLESVRAAWAPTILIFETAPPAK